MKDDEYYQFTNSCYIKKASRHDSKEASLIAIKKSLSLKEQALKSMEFRLREKEKELEKREQKIKETEEKLNINNG